MQDARRWVVGTCRDIGRDDLVECAEIGVSELVTNALMHAESPIQVRVRGTREHPRVEVRDSSIDVPPLPETTTLQDEADLLLTFGRGLSIVARAADAWGVEREEDGKTVWFAPAQVFAEEGVEGRVTGAVAERAADPSIPAKERVEVELRDVPVAAYVAFTHHYQELRREVGLLALAHQQDYPLAKNLSDLFGSLEQPLRAGLGSERIEAAQTERRGVDSR